MARVKSRPALRAYVLLESVFAMIILMICFGIAMMIYENVVNHSQSQLALLARYRIQTEATLAKSEKLFLGETKEYDEFRIEKKVTAYQDETDVFEMELKAIAPNGKLLYDYHELIHEK
jgi:hypothetical protein